MATVDYVTVKGSAWSAAFTDWLDDFGYGHPLAGPNYLLLGYYINPTTALTPIPWTTINQIILTFSEAVTVEQGDLVLWSGAEVSYGFTGFSYNAANYTATWTLDQVIGTAGGPGDKILLALDAGVVGEKWYFRFNALQCDVDQDGDVDATDSSIVLAALGQRTANGAGFSFLCDVDCNSRVLFDDSSNTNARDGNTLAAINEPPWWQPAVKRFGGVRSVGSNRRIW